MIESFQQFTESLPSWLQWLGVMGAGAVPFIESYFGSVIGIVAGLPPWVAVGAAVTGNVITMLLTVLGADAVRRRFVRSAPEASPRRERLRRNFDRYGVAGVSLLGQTLLPSQITSAALVSFGAAKNAVVFWQVISIVLWGALFGLLATLGLDLLGR